MMIAGQLGAAGKGGSGPPTLEGKLGGMLSQLVVGVQNDDADVMDRITCNDIVSGGRALKQQLMGRIAADQGAGFVDSVKTGYHNEVHAFFGRLASQGRTIRSLDISGVESPLAGDLEQRKWLTENGDVEVQPVTVQGILHLHCDPDDHAIDVPVEQVGTRWCMYPVSLP